MKKGTKAYITDIKDKVRKIVLLVYVIFACFLFVNAITNELWAGEMSEVMPQTGESEQILPKKEPQPNEAIQSGEIVNNTEALQEENLDVMASQDNLSIWAVLKKYVVMIGSAIIFILPSLEIIKNLCASREVKDARRGLKARENRSINTLKSESVLFDISPKKYFFYQGIPIKNDKDVFVKYRKLLRGSYVITGGAGYGKSSVLKQIFLCHARRNRYLQRSRHLFLDADELQTELLSQDAPLLHMIEMAGLGRLVIYIDGPDEVVGKGEYKAFKHCLEEISGYVGSIDIRISCRPEFKEIIFAPEGNAFGFGLYRIENWTKENLLKYTEKIIEKFNLGNGNSALMDFFRNEMEWERVNGNPLLCKMLIYLKSEDKGYTINTNRYLFYMDFLKLLVKIYQVKTNNPLKFEKIIEQYAKEVYETVYTGNRNHEVPFHEELMPIVKKIKDGKAIFKHETFFEFMMSVYVCRQICTLSAESVRVLSCEYPNAFADFISSGILAEDTEKVQKNLMALYRCTLDETNRERNRLFPAAECFPEAERENIEESIKRLTAAHFFTLKYQIIFRLGRLHRDDIMLKEFLAFVYYEDEQIFPSAASREEPKNKEEYQIVLKRCCAISASFIGQENIELDYVKHMLAYRGRDEYLELYDKINQFHTLLYYGDIPMPEGEGIDLTEMSDLNIFDCYKACRKRLERLTKLNDYTSDVEHMNVKEKRIYYFRVFDIATLYTFIHSRRNSGNLRWADQEVQAVIREFRTDFQGISPERQTLLEEIKQHTLQELQRMLV